MRISLPAAVLVVVAAPCLGAELVDLALGVDPWGLDHPPRLSPSWAHPLGTDGLGRDQLSRLLHGGRVSLTVAALGTLGALVIGTSLGVSAGWRGGRWEAGAMRLTESVAALPKLPLMLVLVGLDIPRALDIRPSPGGQVLFLGIIIAALSWPEIARLTRAATRTVRDEDFVRAAEGLGMSPFSVLGRHVLPHIAPPLSIAAALDLATNVFYESMLSFVGLGLSPPTPSWGRLLARATAHLSEQPWMAVVPGLLTALVVASLHGWAEELRAARSPASARLIRRSRGS